MFSLKGFASHSSLVNNTSDTVNNIGELSTLALTYAKDKGIYVSSDVENITLTSFLAATDGTAEVLSSTVRDHILAVIAWAYDYSFKKAGEINSTDFLNAALDKFTSTASSFASGEVVNDGTYYIPEWVSWTYSGLSGSFIKIWFSDASFRAQYDEFEIVVVPPIESIDTFLGTATSVKKAIAAIDMADYVDRVQTAKDSYPETLTRFIPYAYTNPSDSTDTTTVLWAVIIYGVNGNNVDSINDAISTYVLANSASGRSSWATVFPDIFKRTEFIIVPNWSAYAIENRTVQKGIYTAAVKLAAAKALVVKYAPDYNTSQIENYMEWIPHPYKCLGFGAVGSSDNKNSLYSLTDVFPDYLPLASSTTDFNRMTSATREFCEALSEMMLIAEDMTAYSTISDSSYTKLTRNSILYLVWTQNNIHYMVVAKSNFS